MKSRLGFRQITRLGVTLVAFAAGASCGGWTAFGRSASAPGAQPRAGAAWTELMAGNRRFVAGKPNQRDLVATRRSLAEAQHPKAIILGCSDSRVGPELLFDQTLGDLFVVRTAGNVADRVALGSIEYAVEHLHAPLLVVLGHDKCGAVAAAASGEKMPTPSLQALVDMISPALAPLRKRASGADLVSLGVEANVNHSAEAIVRGSPIVRDHASRGELAIIRAVYHLEGGNVVRLGPG